MKEVDGERIKIAYLKVTSGYLSIKYSISEPEKGQREGGGVIMDTAQVKKKKKHRLKSAMP